ncbi:hypothetical protein DID88_004288 [Monilinia fructigena]|uniref:ATPase inhibitor, mitochondrial n=1 Tax=Monilinia fructigena TaxID=38457 RepID=A0A395IXZ4_9HELO|nr:hypothetical protein DID88_004288 [Monilinia fructigena]
MYRLAINSAMRPAHAPWVRGDTGATRFGGQQDAFTKREKANEDYTIRQRENEKLLELKKKINEQRDHLKKLEDHISENREAIWRRAELN